MGRPAVFFDRDNTLIVSDGYLADPADVVLVDGAADAVARVRAMGFAAVVFSNQSGVARGMFTEDAVYAVNGRLDELLHEDNPAATIDRHEFCPFHPQATVPEYRQASELRKPAPGMIFRAASTLDLDVPTSWVIGDAPRDIAAGHAAGCRSILLKVPDLPASPAAEEPITVAPDFVAMSLSEAVDLIEREREKNASAVPVKAEAGVGTAGGSDEGHDGSPTTTESEAPAEPVTEAAPTPAAIADLARTAMAADAEEPDRVEALQEVAEPPPEAAPPEPATVVSTSAMSESNDQRDRTGRDESAVAFDAVSPVISVASGATAADEPEPTYAPPVSGEAKMTWGERMRAAKAQGLLPTKSKSAANDAPDAEAAGPGESSEPADAPPAGVPTAAEPGATDAADAPPPTPPAVATTTPMEPATPPPAGPSDEAGAQDREPLAAAPRRVLPAEPVDADEPRTTGTRPAGDLRELESLVAQVLAELKRSNDPASDFALGKLMAGVVFILSVFLLGYAVFLFLRDNSPHTFESMIRLSIGFLTLTIALLVMGRQR